MEEKKQIQEMAKLIMEASCQGRECENCAWLQSVEDAEECCVCLKALYNAGYRRISKDAVVLSRERYEWLTCCFGKFEEIMNDIKELAHKEIAKKILRDLYSEATSNVSETVELTTFQIEQLAKQFGVEVEDSGK